MDGISGQVGTILFGASYVTLIVGWVWVSVTASRSAIWKGLVCFLVPLALIVYGLRHWNDINPVLNTRLAMITCFIALGGIVLSLLVRQILSPA